MRQKEFSLKDYFIPLTTAKVITWIVLIGLIIYCNSLFNGFVWDDMGQVVNNVSVRSLANIASFFFGGQDINGNIIKIHAAFYRPLMESLFTIIYSFFGSGAFFFHVVSLIMHIAIALFVYFFFSRFFKKSLSFFLAVILLVHPLNSEAVDYISAYNDLMYLFFGLISVLLLPKHVVSVKRLIALSACLFLSLLSKEPGFLFIPIIIGYAFLYYKKNTVRIVLASFLVVVLYIILRNSLYVGLSEEKAFGFSPFLHMSPIMHLANIPKLFAYYLDNFMYPNQLAIAQQWSVQKITFADFYLPLVILIAFIAGNLFLLVKAYQKKELLKNSIFFSLWFWIGIGLYFQLIPLDMTVADRWFYFPMIGLLGLVGTLFQEFKTNKNYRSVVLSIGVICIILLSIRTIIRNTNWNSERSLYLHDITVTQNSFDLENLVGMIYFEEHNLPVAKSYFQKSISLYRCSDAVNNLGYLYQSIGNIQSAEQLYYKAVTCSEGYKDYGNLVVLLYKLHKYDSAERYTKEAIQQYPNGAGLYFVLGLIEYKKGDKENALKNLAIGYKLSQDPQIANAYQLMEQNKPVDLPL